MTTHTPGTAGTQIRLTPRETQVLSLLCEGLPNKLICRELGISVSTVKIHISHILGELNVTSRLQAVVLAKRLGVVADAGGDESKHRSAAPAVPASAMLSF